MGIIPAGIWWQNHVDNQGCNYPSIELEETASSQPIRTKQLWHRMDEQLYKETVEQYLADTPNIACAEEAVKYLIDVLKVAADKAVPVKIIKASLKPKPFNEGIKRLMAESKTADWLWKREGSPAPPDPIAVNRKTIRKLLRKAQAVETAMRRDHEYEEIMQAHQQDNLTFHKLIRRQRQTPQSTITELEVNGVTHQGDLLGAWTSHFSSLATPKPSTVFDEDYKTQVEEDVKAIHRLCDMITCESIPITQFEVSEAIAKLKRNKAQDEEHLVAESLQHGGPPLINFLTQIINKIIETKEIPELIKGGIMHPIHKKGKPINISGNYRGISIISIICKVLDLIQLSHHNAVIPQDKCDLQFSFTEGRSPTQATIVLSELLAEAKDEKKCLIVITLDIQKAFDMISHPHLLRKLYLAGLTGRWWVLKENSYSKMTSRVTWQGQLGKKFMVYQGNRQGGNGSPGDFKEYTFEHLDTMADLDLGTNIGSTYTGTLACADDVLMTAWDQHVASDQLGMITFLNNRDRLPIHPQKTQISIFQTPQIELQHLQESEPWNINGTPIPVGKQFVHLGIEYDLSTYNGTARATVDSRLKLGRSTIYSLMGAGLHGINGINPISSLHIYTIYVMPRVIYGLEGIDVNPSNIARLETAHRAFIRNIQSLPKRTAIPALFILSGILPIEAIIDCKRLNIIPSLCKNPTINDIIHRQTAMKELSSSSWVIKTQLLLNKYNLKHLISVIQEKPSKECWKKQVDEAIHDHWATVLRREAATKSSIKFLNHTFSPGEPHLIWRAVSTDPRDVRRAAIKAKILAGAYILQCNRARFNHTCNTTCPLCGRAEEDLPHFLLDCQATQHLRTPIMHAIIGHIPLTYRNHPGTGWSELQLTQLIVDPTHQDVAEVLPLQTPQLIAIETTSRELCFKLHRYRALTLGFRP